MTQSIAISSGKGGVGKSTISTNLALTLAKMGNKTLLLDADLGMANIHFIIGIHPTVSLDNFINQKIDINKIPIKVSPNLDFISGGSAIHNLLNLNETERYSIIRSFNNLDKKYDYMIIDIGAGADTSITSFMAASSKNILIVNPEPSSFNDSYQLMRAANFDHEVNNFGVFMNQAISELHGKRMYDRFEAITTKFVEGYNPKYLGSLKNSQNYQSDKRLLDRM